MPRRCVSPAVGVDGYRAGWVCAVADDSLSVRVVADFNAVQDLTRERNARRMLVDIPIGLSESDRRACDRATRERLGSRAATVFFAPVQPVLDTDSHGAASATNRKWTGAGLSIQAQHLVPKIRETNTVLREASCARSRVFESHPEFAFAALTGDPLPEPKSTPEGRTRRLNVLGTAFGGYDDRDGGDDDDSDDGSEADATDDREFDAEHAYRETLDRVLRRGVARDNVLNALVLAVAAQRPLAAPPNDPPTGAIGLRMATRVLTGGPPP